MAILYQYITWHYLVLSIPFLVNFDKPDLSLLKLLIIRVLSCWP